MTESREKTAIPRYLAGVSASVIALFFLVRAGLKGEVVVFLASSFFLLICITDTLYSRISNLANLALLVAGFACNFYLAGTHGLISAALGLLLGFSLFIIPHLMGGMGAGDVKALAALGALVGPGAIFQVFLYCGLIGGVLGIVHYALGHNLREKCSAGIAFLWTYLLTRDVRDLQPTRKVEQLRFPYAAAIALGFFAYVNWGRII